ncbi:ATP synthase F1 subunit epsilon [Abiotrophia defectiva]|jgi:hypothetical protein|uniref:ATP synthase F1 subunit epsilon n=1 Tax=Abiotrophia defectiva TaxID=46125 RepID=UPI0028D6C619|nr:ATP synthase F1 subunit epsilon [Abiotrophia defectiva]
MANPKDQHTMRVRIYSPQGVIYDHQALSCSVRAVDGGLTVLPNHTPILAPLELSVVKVVRVHEGFTDDFIAINGGVLEMRNNEVEIISNYAIRGRDIDEAQVSVEQQEAEINMQEAIANKDSKAFIKAKIELDRAMNKITAFRRKRGL